MSDHTITIPHHDFYAQDARTVARALIGAILVRRVDGVRLAGRIVETEAYRTTGDLASHARMGKTPRNLPMWEAPGRTFVYLTYGVHWLLNAVCEPAETPAAVLIRAIEPLDGLDVIGINRAGRPFKQWTSGPGRLTKALAINRDNNRADLTTPASDLWIELGAPVPDADVQTGPRIGLGKHVPDPWLSIPWRWWIKGHPHVSR
ncbi:MAG: DNA-3-methyladenine glycosylase [Anaerolineae bacterium]|nr:DNA-3-methyladenine glycosylase [Anaerolineae bacterium]